MKGIKLVSIVILLAVVFTACKKDKEIENNPASEKIIAKWKLNTIKGMRDSAGVQISSYTDDYSPYDSYFDFRSDNKAYKKLYSVSSIIYDTSNYVVDNTNNKFTFSNSTAIFNISELSNNSLKFYNENGTTIISRTEFSLSRY